MFVLLRLYLTRGEKPDKNSHPGYWYPWLFNIQMLEVLMEQPANTNQSVKDGNKAVSVSISRDQQRKTLGVKVTDNTEQVCDKDTTPSRAKSNSASLSFSPQEHCMHLGTCTVHWCYSRRSPRPARGRRRRNNGGLNGPRSYSARLRWWH